MPKKTLAHRESVHRMGNNLQAILAYVEMDEHDKALKIIGQVGAEIRRLKALNAARETIVQLNRMSTALRSPVTLPKGGRVVVPHGTRVLSHEDVSVDVDPNEVRVVEESDVRPGHGAHNPKTK